MFPHFYYGGVFMRKANNIVCISKKNRWLSINQDFYQKFVPYLFLSPALILFSLFLFFPVVFAFYMSFHKWGMIGEPRFIGFKNYFQLLKDPIFWVSVKNTIVFSLSVPLKVALALIFSIILNQKVKGLGFFRTAFFFPSVLSMVVVGVIWQWMFSPNYGFINYALSKIGLPKQNMLINPSYAIIVIIVVSVWKGLGNNMLIFLAGLQAIPKSVYEAADIDGASRWQKFWYITLPLLKPTTLFVLIITLIGSFKIFDLAYVITGGGPGNSTLFLVHYIYREAFQRFDMGYASAAAYIFFVILFILTIIQVRWFSNNQDY